MEIFGDMEGLRTDAAIWRHFKHYWASWFPTLGTYQHLARQAANLTLLKQELFRLSRPTASAGVYSIEGFPIPVCRYTRARRLKSYKGAYGYCASKKESYYGFKGHVVVDLDRYIEGFTLTAANVDEREVLENVVGEMMGFLLGDKGYISHPWRERARENGLSLTTPVRSNMLALRDERTVKLIMDTRRRVETTIGQLVETFSFCTVKARDVYHLAGRLVRKRLAYNLSGVLGSPGCLASRRQWHDKKSSDG